jgi:hypothetical protein
MSSHRLNFHEMMKQPLSVRSLIDSSQMQLGQPLVRQSDFKLLTVTYSIKLPEASPERFGTYSVQRKVND